MACYERIYREELTDGFAHDPEKKERKVEVGAKKTNGEGIRK